MMANTAPQVQYVGNETMERSKADKKSDKGKREGSKADNRADRTLLGKHKRSRVTKTSTPIGFDDEAGGF
jgi:hypothetical protein